MSCLVSATIKPGETIPDSIKEHVHGQGFPERASPNSRVTWMASRWASLSSWTSCLQSAMKKYETAG